MASLRVVGAAAYIAVSVIFLYWRVQVTLNDAKCPRRGMLSEYSQLSDEVEQQATRQSQVQVPSNSFSGSHALEIRNDADPSDSQDGSGERTIVPTQPEVLELIPSESKVLELIPSESKVLGSVSSESERNEVPSEPEVLGSVPSVQVSDSESSFQLKTSRDLLQTHSPEEDSAAASLESRTESGTESGTAFSTEFSTESDTESGTKSSGDPSHEPYDSFDSVSRVENTDIPRESMGTQPPGIESSSQSSLALESTVPVTPEEGEREMPLLLEKTEPKAYHNTRELSGEQTGMTGKGMGKQEMQEWRWDPFGAEWLLQMLEASAEAIHSALKDSSDSDSGVASLDGDDSNRPSAFSSLSAEGLPLGTKSLLLRRLISQGQKEEQTQEEQAPHLLSSPLTVLSLLNIMAIFAFVAKEACLGTLSFMEAHRLVEMALGYVFVKLIFFVIVLDSIEFEGVEWLLLWVCFFGVLKVLERLAKERFQRLTASPSATVVHHARTLGLLLIVLATDVLVCLVVLPHFPALTVPKILLLAYEAAAVGIETIQTLARYAFHLAEEFPDILAVAGKLAPFSLLLSSGVSGAEWRASVLHHLNALFDVSGTLLTLLHCVHLWQLHGFSFHIIDIVLFLNARSLVGKLVKRGRSFLRWRSTLKNLQSALPDASAEDLSTFADDCAICKEPMSAAKRLPCGHLFHLSCLRSWLDQGMSASHSCPSCRRPLHPETETPQTLPPLPAAPTDPDINTNASLTFEIPPGAVPLRDIYPNFGMRRQRVSRAPSFSPQTYIQSMRRFQAVMDAWREGRRNGGAGEQDAASDGANAAADDDVAATAAAPAAAAGAAASRRAAAASAGGGGASGSPQGDTHRDTTSALGEYEIEDMQEDRDSDGVVVRHSGRSASPPLTQGMRYRGSRAEAPALPQSPPTLGLRDVFRQMPWMRRDAAAVGQRQEPAVSQEEQESRLLALAAQVEEILPHVPFNLIIQDLRRTNSVVVTVNNLMDTW